MIERENEEYATPQDPAYGKERRISKSDSPGRGVDGAVPNLGARVVVGVFDQQQQASTAGQELIATGIPADDISIIAQPPGTAPETTADETHADRGMVAGASTGALVGGIAGLALLAIPGVGPLFAIGPITAAISGAVTGGALGGLIGAFSGLGIPTEQAQAYEAAVRAGGVVLTLKVEDHSAADETSAILRRNEAREIESYSESL